MQDPDTHHEVIWGSVMLWRSIVGLCLVCILFVVFHCLWTMNQRHSDIQHTAQTLSLTTLSVMPSGHAGRYQSLLHPGVNLRHTPQIAPELLKTESILLSPLAGVSQ